MCLSSWPDLQCGHSGKPPLEHGAREGDAGFLATAGLGQELVDLGGDGFVKVVFLPSEFEGDGMGVAVGEEAIPL